MSITTTTSSPTSGSSPAAGAEPKPHLSLVRPLPLFSLGRALMTPSVSQLAREGQLDPLALLRRHVQGDWGDLCDEDRSTNQAGLRPLTPGRLMSVYKLSDTLVVWIITEYDRSVTTLLLPSEY